MFWKKANRKSLIMISLVFLLTIVDAAKIGKVWEFSDALAGTLAISSTNYGHPTSASVVHTGNNQGFISMEFFPIETCQAVKICIIEKLAENQRTQIVLGDKSCANRIEYFPPTGKIIITQNPNKAEGYTTKLAFDASATSYQIDLYKKPFSRKGNYEKDKPAPVELHDKTLIILTNSRQCHAQFMYAGKLLFSDIYTSANFEGQFPVVFEYEKTGSKTETYFTHTARDDTSQRKYDSLAHLKLLTKAKPNFGTIQFKCSLTGGGLSNREKYHKASVFIVNKFKSNRVTANDKAVSRIVISTADCHWFRLWFTTKTAWSDYASTIGSEIHQTIDVFLNEGFVLLPDRENSIRLPGASRQIQFIAIDHHGGGIVEISFGRMGSAFINPISFNLKIMQQDNYNVFMIRAPKCDARFSLGIGKQLGKMTPNTIEMRNCQAFSISKPA